jgi:PAS domain S-box-containing protein
MNKDIPTAGSDNPGEELADLVGQMRALQERIQELSGNELDAITDNLGRAWLMPDAQQKLVESENLQRQEIEKRQAILDALPAHIAVLDRNADIVAVNNAWREFAKLNGHLHENCSIGDNYIEVCRQSTDDSQFDAHRVIHAIGQALAGKFTGFQLEYPCHSPDEQRWFRFMVNPLPTTSGAVVMHIDITERYAVEYALRSSEQRYRLLFDSNPHPMWVFDIETLKFLSVNAMARKVYGYSEEEFKAMDILEIRPEDERERVGRIAEKSCPGGRVEGVFRHQLKNGERIRVEIHTQPIEFDGRSARLVMAVDITREEQLEEQLRQSQRLESVGQLTGGIAHDFNNLLTVILGNAELLFEMLEGDQARQPLAEMIEKAALRGSQLTQRLLAFAQRQPLNPDEVDINPLIEQLIPMLRRTLGESIEIDAVLGPRLPTVLVDAAQLESALLNLSLNARDAMAPGGRLQIKTGRVVLGSEDMEEGSTAEPGTHLRLTVSDTGTGIPDHVIGRVFEPFFTTKEKGKGTGLGLSMVYGFVRQSRGLIRILSVSGQGTRIEIDLPTASENRNESIRSGEQADAR